MTTPVQSLSSITRILSITFLVVYVISASALPTANANTLVAAASASEGGGVLSQNVGRQQQLHHLGEEGPSKRETYRKLMRSYNPIIMYHQSIRHPRFLALLTGKDPADSAPRRMARRGSDYNNNPYSTAAATAAYTSGARPSWNHQILQSFFRNKQPYSLQNVKMNNNNKRSSSFGWKWSEDDVDEGNEILVDEDYADQHDYAAEDY